MAAGDWKWFAQGLHDIGNKVIDLDTDVLKFGLVNCGFDAYRNAGGAVLGGWWH